MPQRIKHLCFHTRTDKRNLKCNKTRRWNKTEKVIGALSQLKYAAPYSVKMSAVSDTKDTKGVVARQTNSPTYLFVKHSSVLRHVCTGCLYTLPPLILIS